MSGSLPSEDSKRITLGIGTGRNGSESLSYLLNSQNESCYSHEFGLFSFYGERAQRHRPPLHWHGSLDVARQALESLKLYRGRYVGDIGMYWLPYLPQLCQEYPQLQVICIYRSRNSTVESFLKKTEGRNHWIEHDGTEWEIDPLWDPVFPNYPVSDKAEAIGLYWDHYQEKTEELLQAFPNQIKVMKMSALNDQSEVAAMLKHAGFEKEDIKSLVTQRRNKRDSFFAKVARRLKK